MSLVPLLSVFVGATPPERLPEALGEYPVWAQLHHIRPAATGPLDKAMYLAHIAAQLTLEKAPPPAPYKEIPFLKSLPLVTAALRVFEPERLDNFEIDGAKVQLDDPSTTALLVPAAALAKALYKAYGINLQSLSSLRNAAAFDGWSHLGGGSSGIAGALAKQAFGHALHEQPSGGTLPTLTGAQSHTTTPPFSVPTSGYYYLADVYYCAALLDLIKAGEIRLPLPASDCAIVFSDDGEELAAVRYFDRGDLEGSPPVPLEVRKEYGKPTNNNIAEIFRLRHEIRESREQRRQLLDVFFRFAKESVAETPLSDAEAAKQEQLRHEAELLYARDRERQEQLIPLYADLTHWVSTHKERILRTVRERERVAGVVARSPRAEHLIELPNNMDGLPAHFAAIPKGLTETLELTNDPFGRAILRVGRTPLHLAGQKAREHTPFTLPIFDVSGAKKSAAIQQAESIFGKGGPRWLIPQGLVAVSKLYRAVGGYSKEGFVHRLYLNDWIDAMRPAQAARFREKGGRKDAFAGRNAADLYQALLGVLHRLTYSRENGPEWSQLSGFYIIVEDGEDSRGLWTDIMLNPNLHKFVIGTDGLPYMATNTEAMLSYNRASLDYTPAAQWGLEQLARENIYNRDTATLSDPQGGGFTRLTLAHRFGLIEGLGESPSHLLKRFDGILDNLGNAGVIADVKLDGKEKTGASAFSVKLLITMHEDYRRAYNLTRARNKLEALDKQLEAPFAPPRKLARPPAAAAPRKRGRPPKQKA